MAEFGGLQGVQLAERVQAAPAQGAVHAGRIVDEEHGIALRPALHALVDRGNEAAAPAALTAGGLGTAGDEDNKAGQVFIFRSKTVGGPGAHRRPALTAVTGEQQQLGGRVIELVGVHRAHQRDLIGQAMEVRAGIAHPHPSTAMALKAARRAKQLGHTAGEGEGAALEEGIRTVLAGAFHQLRFVVEKIQVRRRPGHVQVDHPLRLGGVMRRTGIERARRTRIGQGLQGDRAQAELAGGAEKLAAGAQVQVFEAGRHLLPYVATTPVIPGVSGAAARTADRDR